MRYILRPHYDRILGRTIEVYDMRARVVASVFERSPLGIERAERRVEELNRADTEGQKPEKAD